MIDFFERLDKFMIFKGLNDNKITLETGISNGLIGKARKKGGGISLENISKILNTYPELSAEWLLRNSGEMLKNQNITINSGDNNGAIVGNNHGKISIKKEKKLTPEELLFQREISYLNEKIETKNREIKILEREITSFKGILNEVNNIKMETEKSRSLITDLYERKINDLKHTIAVLEAQMGLKLSN